MPDGVAQFAIEKLYVVEKSYASHRTKLSGLSRGNFKTALLSLNRAQRFLHSRYEVGLADLFWS